MNAANIPASELPIRRRATCHYTNLWNVFDAMHFCRALCKLPAIPTITPEEYAIVAKVADGELWPVPDHPYTHEQWEADESFNAVGGQEVTQDIYEYMFEVLPPLNLPRCERTQGYAAGFMVSEPHCCDPTGRNYYSAFGRRGGKCYFIGLLSRKGEYNAP